MDIRVLLTLAWCLSALCQGDVRISFIGHDVTYLTEAIRVIEGSSMVFGCVSPVLLSTYRWVTPGGWSHGNSNLTVHSVRLSDAGTYSCEATWNNTVNQVDGISAVEIVVLYPPSRPVIKGQASILHGEPLIFTCYSAGHPPPTFEWRYFSSTSQLLSRNQTLTLTASQYVSPVLCRVQNTMIPSYDFPKSSALDILKYIYVTTPAVIKSLPYFQDVKVGDDLNVRCDTYGKPAPTIRWSKVGDETFLMLGSYLYFRYVQISFAGDYMCSIENVVIPTNNSKITTRDSQTVHIVVNEPSSPLPCPDHCQTPALASTDHPCSNTEDVSVRDDSTMTVTESPDDVTGDRHSQDQVKTCDEDGPYMGLLIVTTTVICLLLVISVVANVSLCMCHRRKSNSSESKLDGVAHIAHELNETNVTHNEQVRTQSVATHYDIGRVAEATVSPGVSHPEDGGSEYSYEHPYSILVQ